MTLAECVYGSRGYNLADLAGARVTHIPLRATTMAWSKECLLNIAISRLPPGAEKIATFDADVTFRRSGWTTEALAALDLYPVIQPWDTAYDLGPHDEHIQTHKSFASVWHAGKPVVAKGDKFWQFNGGYAVYPHSGYAWAWTRRALDRIGGLFELGGIGSGDDHMALGLVGAADSSMPGGAGAGYRAAVKVWESRMVAEINGKLGLVHSTIEHPFHGRERPIAATARAGRYSKTMASTRIRISSATPVACWSSPATNPTSSARSTATSARGKRTSIR